MRRLLVLVCGLALVAMVCPAVASASPTPPASPQSPSAGSAGTPPVSSVLLDHAFALRGANACSWSVGSPGIKKAFSFDARAGTYMMTSFENTLVRPARQYVAGAPSAEFRFNWDGVTLTGASGGWSCTSGQVRRVDVSGEPALQLDVTLSRPTVEVTKHYVIYPRVALIREWTSYTNIGITAHQLARPSFLEQRVMGDVIGDTDLHYMDGAYQYTLETVPLTADYARTFDSYGDDGTFRETTNLYEPWFSLFDRATKDGIYAGFDYFGRWAATVGRQDGTGTSLSLEIPNYDAPLAPGASIDSPKAFSAVYQGDLDDMTNRLLYWQYAYMWDYTRAPYFTAVRDEGPQWWVGIGDAAGLSQMAFGLVDSMRAIGADDYHRDYGWWDRPGDWDGPDWRITHDYLAKSGMSQTIYYFAYDAESDSRIGQQHPDWFSDSPCSYGGGLVDLGIPAARAWMQGLLVENAQRWGDYEWRNDACPMTDWPGDRQLAQDQGFRSVLQGFLDARPGSGFHGVDSGGNEFGFDFLRFADGTSFTDANGYLQQDGGSRLYPVDKLSGVPEAWRADGGASDVGSCDARFNTLLMWNPDLQGDTADPVAIECMRKIIDIYHYLVAEGVAGRWVRQYHPHGTDDDTNWFERLSADGQRGLIIYKGGAVQVPVTVYPKGLNPQQSYDVRFEFHAGASQRSGADLMASGITLPTVGVGELIYLNLPGHPGSGTDHTQPTPPAEVTATADTNMGYHGVEVSWTPGSDDNWVSYYEVLRDGAVIGKVAKGTFYFDHTPAATPAATYAVRTVDGDANRSALTSAQPDLSAATQAADDASGAITYVGPWSHQSAVQGPYAGTQSEVTGTPPPLPCHLACQGFGDTQGQHGWGYQTSTAGQWSDIMTYRAFGLAGDCCSWFDLAQNYFSGLVSPRFMLPGVGHDVARSWTAPKDGVADISAQAIPYASGNHSVLTITKNGQPVWGPQTLDGTTTTVDTSVPNLAVTAGDVIRFEVQGVAAIDLSSLLRWDPDITYHGDPPPPPLGPSAYTASWTFTGSQVSWYAHLGPDYGIANVLIDGKPDAAIDLYAPSDGWSVPVYGKTFATSAAHTITIMPTGQSVQGASDPKINIDGFRVITASPAVTEENSAVVSYSGPGWQAQASDAASSGAMATDATAGSSATFTFTGRSVTWVGRICPACGEADVYLDGKYVTRVDTYGYRGPEVWQTALFQHSWPDPGSHTLKIVVDGTHNLSATGDEVDVDSFQVRPG